MSEFKRRYGYEITPHLTFGEQLKGENQEGIEIKLDRRCTQTGQLSIEIAERHARTYLWTPSGIMRKDNTRFYVQGNSEIVFIFRKSALLDYYNNNRPRISEWGKDPTHPTVRRFFLPLTEARHLARRIWE